MMRRLSLSATVSCLMLLTACGSGEVVVIGELAGAGPAGESIFLRDMPVYLLPYDRDAIFDSLEAAYPVPEPPIPDTLVALQAAISQANEELQRAENLWGTFRDSLQRLNDQMQSLSRASAQYRLMFDDFQALERELAAIERQRDAAFERFASLQSEFASQSQEVRAARAAWADDAFADVNAVIAAKLEEAKRDEVADTTAADGTVRVRVKPGRWWVHARHALPYDELYWNIPVDVARGEVVEVRLTRENAEVRPRL